MDKKYSLKFRIGTHKIQKKFKTKKILNKNIVNIKSAIKLFFLNIYFVINYIFKLNFHKKIK